MESFSLSLRAALDSHTLGLCMGICISTLGMHDVCISHQALLHKTVKQESSVLELTRLGQLES